MHPIDWTITGIYLIWMVWDGLRLTKRSHELEGYFLGGRSLPWWAVGLSVMATQLSAITIVGTTGQAYTDGLRFIQFYFGLPIAMVLLSVTVVPFFHRARIYTAYEYLENRFDAKTRSLASFLFLLGRAFSLGVTLAAPAVLTSAILGWGIGQSVALLCVPMIFYTAIGGVAAVAWADVKQMAIIVIGMAAAVVILVIGIGREVPFGQAMELAGATGRLDAIDFRVALNERYTFWSGMIGGLFLMLSYFGCDQSQVQRYLTAKSVDEARHSLLMSGYVKIPLQLLILGAGVLVFVFYLFQTPPMLFNRVHDADVQAGPYAGEYVALQSRFDSTFAERRTAAIRNDREAFLTADTELQSIRSQAAGVVRKTTGNAGYSDVNYVFPTFIMTQMPIGIIGLMIAAILAAAMSTAAGELNALTSVTIIDFYRRHFNKSATEDHLLKASKLATIGWGLFACVVAAYASGQGSLVEVVNRYGSFFYGSLLGVFMLAVLTKRATATGAFWGLIAGMAVVLLVAETTSIEFLWHNLIGAVTVMAVGMGVSLVQSKNSELGN
jgi:SSS family transporter